MLAAEVVARFVADVTGYVGPLRAAQLETAKLAAVQKEASGAIGSTGRSAKSAAPAASQLAAAEGRAATSMVGLATGATSAGRGVAGAGRAMSSTGGAATKTAMGLGKAKAEMSAIATTATSHLVPGLHAGENAMARFTGATQSGLSGARVAFGLMGVAALVGIGKSIEKTGELAAETRKLSRQLGLTAEDASRLRQVGHTLGVDVDSLSRGFGIFAKNLVNNSVALQKYGIEAVRAADGQVDFLGTLGEISEKFLSLPNGLDRTAFAMNVFGRSGKDLIPILSQGKAGLAELGAEAERLGLVFSEKDLVAARELAIAHRELNASFEGLEVSLGRGFLPVMKTVTEFTTDAVAAFNLLPAPMRTAAVGTVALIGGLTALGVVVGFVRRGLGNLGIGFGAKATAEAASIAADVAQAGAATAAGESFTLLIADASGVVVAERAVAGSAVEATVALDAQVVTSGRLAVAMRSGLAQAGLVAGAVLGTFLLLKAGVDAANRRLEEARQTIISFGRDSSRSAESVALISAQTAKWTGSPGFRALGHLTTDAKASGKELGNLQAAHEHLAYASLTTLLDQQRVANAIEGTTKAARIAKPHLADLAAFLGTSSRALVEQTISAWSEWQAALADPKATDEARRGWANYVDETLAKAKEWKAGLAESLNFARSSLSDLASSAKSDGQAVADALSGIDAKASLGAIDKALRDSIAAANQYQSDWKRVMDRAGGDAGIVADAVAAMGDNAGNALHQLAGASASDFSKVVGDMKTVADQAQLTSDQILVAFDSKLLSMGDYRANLKLVTRTFGDSAKGIIEFVSGMGEQGGVILNALADSVRDGSKKTAAQVIGDFNKSGRKADDTATVIARTLGRTLEDIKGILEQIAVAWGVKLNLEDHVTSKLNAIQRKILSLDGQTLTLYERTIHQQIDEPGRYGGLVTSAGIGMHVGGMVPAFVREQREPILAAFDVGGTVPGGWGGGDRVRAVLEPGEFVMPKEAVRAFGVGVFEVMRHPGPAIVREVRGVMGGHGRGERHMQAGGSVGTMQAAPAPTAAHLGPEKLEEHIHFHGATGTPEESMRELQRWRWKQGL